MRLRTVLAGIGVWVAVSCSGEGDGKAPAPKAVDPVVPIAAAEPASASAKPARAARCTAQVRRTELAEGLILEQFAAELAPDLPIGDRCIRALRIDPARFDVRLGSAPSQRRGAKQWARDTGAVAVTNASMFHSDGRSTGLMVDGDHVVTKGVNAKFGAFLAFSPARSGIAPLSMAGKGCPGFNLSKLRRDYRAIVQNYRMLDCDGRAIHWKDDKVYSAAVVGVDTRGHLVFVHSRSPYVMRRFARVLTAPPLSLTAAMYVEGGPEATLHIATETTTRTFVGSYETDFHESDDNRDDWELPNVLLVVPNKR